MVEVGISIGANSAADANFAVFFRFLQIFFRPYPEGALSILDGAGVPGGWITPLV